MAPNPARRALSRARPMQGPWNKAVVEDDAAHDRVGTPSWLADPLPSPRRAPFAAAATASAPLDGRPPSASQVYEAAKKGKDAFAAELNKGTSMNVAGGWIELGRVAEPG